MKKIFNFCKNHSLICTLFLVLILSIMASFPTFLGDINEVLHSDDGMYHIGRIMGIAEGLKGGQFPVKILPNTLNGYGYASPLFYPDVFLYIPAFLVLIGIPIKIVYILFSLAIVVIASWLFWILAKKFSSNTLFLCLSTILFSVNQYFFVDIFYRSALGESLACVFYMVLFIGIYNMVKEDFSKPWIILIAMVGIALSHTISLAISAIFLIVIVLCNAKKLLTKKDFYKKIGIIIPVFICCIAYFYVPLLELMMDAKYQLSNPWTKPSLKTVNFKTYFTQPFSLGVLILVAIVFRFFIKKTDENKQQLKWIDIGLIYTIIILFLSSFLFPWSWFDSIFGSIQFPWRLFTLTIASTPLIIMGVFSLLTNRFKYFSIIATIVTVLLNPLPRFDLLYDTYDPITHDSVGAGEWVTIDESIQFENQIEHYLTDNQVYNSNGNAIEYNRKPNTVTISFENNTADDYYLVPLIYYKGYTAKLIDRNGQQHQLTIHRGDYARIKIDNIDIEGTIVVEYEGTTIQTGSLIVSSIAYLGCIIIPTTLYLKKKKKEKQPE